MTYLYGAVALVIACLVAWGFYERSEAAGALAERDRARADLQVAVDANNASQATIGRLQADAVHNDQIIAQMADDLDAINKSVAETNDALGDLKATNEDVRAYLSGAVPDDLKRLLNHQAASGGKATVH